MADLNVVVDADLGFLGGVGNVNFLAGAERLVVLFVAVVERAVGVEALANGEAALVTGAPVGDKMHVARFFDHGGHLFGGGKRQEAGEELHRYKK